MLIQELSASLLLEIREYQVSEQFTKWFRENEKPEYTHNTGQEHIYRVPAFGFPVDAFPLSIQQEIIDIQHFAEFMKAVYFRIVK